MYPPQQSAYDRAITVFSPDGRLFQVEYAREAVRTGATSIGIVSKDGVALIAHKRIVSSLIVGESHEKIFALDKHVAAASSGLVADARKLVDMGRLECQKHHLTYDEAIPVEMLAKKLGDHIQFYTQFGGVRPYGVSLLIAGVSDSMSRLFETDPSGALFEYKATAIGSGKKVVEELMEKEYKDGMPEQEAVKLAIKALKKSVGADEKITQQVVDVTFISKSTGLARQYTRDEIAPLM